MGSMKSENSCESPSDQSKSKTGMSSEVVQAAPSLNFPTMKFELDGGEVEVQSPDWESFFSDHLDGDFMISSPVRNGSSPQTYSYINAMQSQTYSSSPPRFPSPLGPFGASSKGKGQSPLHKMFCNSPNNQFMQIENLSLPAIAEFLNDDYDEDLTKMQLFEPPVTIPAAMDTMSLHGPSRFGGTMSDQSSSSTTVGGRSSKLREETEIYPSRNTTSLSQQLQQERQQEKLQMTTEQQQRRSPRSQQQQFLDHGLMPTSDQQVQEQDSGLQLVHLLLACAEAVSKEDYMLARRYLHQLNRIVSPLGDSMQRVAACFTEALSARLAATLTTKPNFVSAAASIPKPFTPFPPNSMEVLKIYQIVYQACPYVKFAHFTANQAIFEAFEAEDRVHVIDLDILQGYQWPAFMQALAARPRGAPFLRITGVGASIESVRETGRCLTELAHSLHIPFEFHPIGEQLEDIKPHMFNRRVGEALAVNSVNRLHRVPGNWLGNLLARIRDQAPNIVTLVEQEASHNGPYFLGRFLEALHYYSAIFDSLDATFPPDSAQRAKVEQYIFAPEIRNIVACEGAERIERHERLDKWRKMMEAKGFKAVALSPNAVTQSKILLGLYTCDGYRLTEDKGCLLLGWQDRAILAASAWQC